MTSEQHQKNHLHDVAEWLSGRISASRKTQKAIAADVGFGKPNVISQIKSGDTKMPLERIPAMAKTLGVDPYELAHRCMAEYHPNVWKVIEDHFAKCGKAAANMVAP